MIAEVLLVLAGHSSSLFPTDHNVHPAFIPLLHPGEEQCLQSLGKIALRYRKIKKSISTLSCSPSRYVCAVCATLNQILKDEYEHLVVETEAKVLQRHPDLVARGSFVPLSSIRAIFAEWDAPLAALESLVDQLEAEKDWKPGPLIDMLLDRSYTGIHRIADILRRLAVAVQRVWRTQLIAFVVHGSLSNVDPLASDNYTLIEGSMPSCVSARSRDAIAYVGRAISTVKAAKWHKELPRKLASDHTTLLGSVLPQDQHAFDSVIVQIRTNMSEWLWMNVLTHKDVEDAVDSLANYFLLRNGEFSLSVIREIERLKVARLTARSGPSTMIREQDLNLVLLRASLGTAAQHDSALTHLRFHLPSGPLRPLLPSLAAVKPSSSPTGTSADVTSFDDLLLGAPVILSYKVTWPLDLFLYPSDLQIYSAIFSYLCSLRKTHTRIHTCWTSLSNAQRVRRRWTKLGEGGTAEDLELRTKLLRCGWGIVRDMGWFWDTLLGYLMTDVVDVEFRRLKDQLKKSGFRAEVTTSLEPSALFGTMQPAQASGGSAVSSQLDFNTLRNIHTTYLERLLTGCLLAYPALTSIIRPIAEVCDRFVAQVERWGGDVLPALLSEGSLTSDRGVADIVKERWAVVGEINESLHSLLEAFYEQLSMTTSQQPYSAMDASKSIANASMANASTFNHTFIRPKRAKGFESDGEVRRHVERLLLRLDFNGGFSVAKRHTDGQEILREGGIL